MRRRCGRAAIPAIPYAPAAAFLGKEKRKLTPTEGPKRVALVADAIGGVHGVTHTIERIRELGVPGYEIEVIGTDRNVDRRLSAVAEVDIPFYEGLQIGVPSLPTVVETLAGMRQDGLIRHIGLSNISADQLRTALTITDIAAV